MAELFSRNAGGDPNPKERCDGGNGVPLCGENVNRIEDLAVVLLLTISWVLVAARVSR